LSFQFREIGMLRDYNVILKVAERKLPMLNSVLTLADCIRGMKISYWIRDKKLKI